MAKTAIERVRQELDLLQKNLERVSSGIERFTQRYEASKNALSSSVSQLRQISQQYKQLADSIKKLESLRGVSEQFKAIQKLQDALKSVELGAGFRARPERFSLVFNPLRQIEKSISELEKYSFRIGDVQRFFSKTILSRFNEKVSENLRKYLESIYGDINEEVSGFKVKREVTLRTLAKEKGLTLPPGFRSGEIKYLRLEAEQAFDPSIPPEKFQENLDIIIDTITGEVKSLKDFLEELDKFSSRIKETRTRKTTRKEKIKPGDIQKEIEKSINKFSEIPAEIRTELIKRIQEEFKDAEELVKISLSKTSAGTRIKASAGQKSVSINIDKLFNQTANKQRKTTDEAEKDLYSQIRERIETLTHLSERIRTQLTNVIFSSIQDSVDLIKNFEVDLSRGIIKLKGQKLSTGATTTAKFQIPAETFDTETDDTILKQRVITLAAQELEKIREKFGDAVVDQIQLLARQYITELGQYEYIGYDIGTPKLTREFGEVFPIKFTRRQLDVEEPLATAQTAIAFQGGQVVDVVALKRAELEEQRRINELKNKIQSIPGLFEIINAELKRVGATLKDVSTIEFLKLDDDLVEVRILNRELEKLGDTRRIVGRMTERGFVEDPGFKIQQYLLKNKIAANEEIAKAQTQKVLGILEQYGFDLATTRVDISTQLPAGITYFAAKMGDAETGVRKLTVALNKYNDVVTYSNRRTLDFLDAIRQNTIDVFKWSVGATLVYGSYRKLSDALQIAIENEAKLVQIGVVLGDSQQDLNEIFKSAADIAEETGESLTGVLEAYSFAYRAVGGVSDSLEKSAASAELLSNALVLSKLSSLSAAESIDILSGALRQMQKPGETTAQAFAKGRDLLDAWVVTSRKANVDLATLATAFSVVEEQAANVGMSMEQINAMIAALSEKVGGYGGKETGNAIRSIIGGMYTNQAVEALNRFGIATKTASGELRNFLDISLDIYRLYESG
ncbi:MAG: phage tail tape measure protein, partial [Candidatus Micrarchaeia archaeon]